MDKERLVVEYTKLAVEFMNICDEGRKEEIRNRLNEIRSELGMEPLQKRKPKAEVTD